MKEHEMKQFMTTIVEGLIKPKRAPIYRRPDEYGMEYEDVFFQAIDGVLLEGWFIPGDSDKIIICNHFSPGNRYGYPGHLEAFNTSGGFEVNFLPKYKALHDAGYNVLAYDMRNHGMSSEAAGGVSGVGAMEWRDVIGSLRYVREREDTKNMKISLQSLCMGCDATFIAMDRHPEEFEDVVSMIAIQPLSGKPMVERILEGTGVEGEAFEAGFKLYDETLRLKSGFSVSDYDMTEYAKIIKVPTFLIQVHDDLMTKPYDVQTVFENIPIEDKKLFWIEGTNVRYHGYTYFSEHPEQMIEWYDTQMK